MVLNWSRCVLCGLELVSVGRLCGCEPVSAGRAPVCIVLGWSRPVSLRSCSFVLFWPGLGWSWLVSLRVVLFCLVLFYFGLVSAGLAMLCVVLGRSRLVSLRFFRFICALMLFCVDC